MKVENGQEKKEKEQEHLDRKTLFGLFLFF